MQSAMRVMVSIFMLSSAIASYHSNTKLRRDGVLNLYPFPRVGRASPHSWQVPLDDIYLDYEPVDKRQLYAFPRVGRSDLSHARKQLNLDHQPIPVRRTDSPGMWFGPRLGRSFKSDDDITIQNENNDRSEPEQMEPVQEDRKKRETKLF